jgi:hypothetical protein
MLVETTSCRARTVFVMAYQPYFAIQGVSGLAMVHLRQSALILLILSSWSFTIFWAERIGPLVPCLRQVHYLLPARAESMTLLLKDRGRGIPGALQPIHVTSFSRRATSILTAGL